MTGRIFKSFPLLDCVNGDKFFANSYVSTLEKGESVLELGMSASTGKVDMIKQAFISYTSVTLGQLQGLVLLNPFQ